MRDHFHRHVATAALAALLAMTPAGASESATPAAVPSAQDSLNARRLTAEQYQQIVTDIFGPGLNLGGRFEPGIRDSGLLAIGSSKVSVSSAGMEQFNAMARNVAAQVVSLERRATLIECTPASPRAADDVCASTVLAKIGKLLYRRPLTEPELTSHVAAAAQGAKLLNNFYDGLSLSIASMLDSPQFLFRAEFVEPQADGANRLDAYSKASRLSFFLWNSAPDSQLLAAAERGDLHTPKGWAAQVDRMLTSPRVKAGTRAFFQDMLQFEHFDALNKDAALYPKFTFAAAKQAPEQTLRTIEDHLITRDADYRGLFTSNRTFLTPELAALYRVPLAKTSPNHAPDAWQAYTFAPNDPRRGLLSQVSFVGLHSHPGRTSPTLRGKAVRELLMCQRVPDPPGNVDFKIVQDTANPDFKTVRQRLNAHANEAMCKGCHKITDPIGLALENFDTVGSYRTTENDADIDTAGDFNGVEFSDVLSFQEVFRNNAAVTNCLATKLFSYAVGRTATRDETQSMSKMFADSGYRFKALARDIALSPAFLSVGRTAVTAAKAE